MDMCCPEGRKKPDSLQTFTDWDVPEKLQPCLDTNPLVTTKCSYTSTVNTELSPPFLSDPNESLLRKNEMNANPARGAPNKGGGVQDEAETERRLWAQRSNHVKEIITVLQKEFKSLWRSGTTVIEFDIGFAPKQNISAKRFTSFVLYKVVCFALALTSSQLEFILEILESNFDLGKQSECNKKRLAFEVMKTAERFKHCEDKMKLSEMFKLPDFLVANNENNGQQFQRDLGVQAEPETSQKNLGVLSKQLLYCKGTDLDLDVNCCRKSTKLKINQATKGTMVDVVNFAKKLCGNFEQICIDVLRHNFDLDLQSADSDLAKNILAQIPLAIERRKVEQSCKTMPVRMNSFNRVMDCHRVCPEASRADQVVEIETPRTSEDSNIEARNDPALLMWKLRASQVQQILSMHRNQCPFDPYTRCKKLGIDFNVGSGKNRNLDLKLLTNGVMVEFITFADSLWSSAESFLTEILEYNFHLKFQNPQQRRAFAKIIKKQVSDTSQARFTKHYSEKLFELPDLRGIGEYTPFCPKCSFEPKEPGDTPQDEPNTMSEAECIAEDWTEQKPAVLPISTFPAAEVLSESCGGCRKAGLTLCVDKNYPGSKMDKCKLTSKVILEAFNFSKKLCGTKHKIVTDLITHNFNLKEHSFCTSPCVIFRNEMRNYSAEAPWFDAVFDFKPVFQRKVRMKERPSVQKSERTDVLRKRRLDMESLVQREPFEEGTGLFLHQSNAWTSPLPEDIWYMCPVEEDSNSERIPERQWQAEEEEEARVQTNVPNECVVVQEEILTEINMWKWRASRVADIVSVLNQDFQVFRLKLVNLDFNVGSQRKRGLSVACLSGRDLFKTALFALSLNASQTEFIMEILKTNFELGLQTSRGEKSFSCDLMRKVRELTNCEDSVKFSNTMFDLPDFPLKKFQHPSSSIVKTEPSDAPIMGESLPPVAALTLPAETELDSLPKSPQHIKDLYPFCEEIGLKLNIKTPQPIEKLHISRLTNGAMTEVVNFAEKLCGTFEQIFIDVLKHNFDLDLQDADSDLARDILARIPSVIEQKNFHRSIKKSSISKRVSSIPILNHACSPDLVRENQSLCRGKPNDTEVQSDLNLILWKLRTDRIKQILTLPHTEQCPLYSYTRCKKLGIDFNVGSGLKQSLDPKLLTNGVMVEIFTFVDALLSSPYDFMTEILEHNFDVHLNGELRRSAFTNYIRYSCQIKNKLLRHKYLKKAFVLPDPTFLEERAPHCPKCYQIRNGIFPLDGSPHAMTDAASASQSCDRPQTENAPISSPAATELLTQSYRCCKRIGINLIVDRNHPTEKLGSNLLTVGILIEIEFFARKLSGTRLKIVGDILKHNFYSHMLTVLEGDNATGCYAYKLEGAGKPNWFNKPARLLPLNVKQSVKPKKEGKRLLPMQGKERKKRKTVQSVERCKQSLSIKPTNQKHRNQNSSRSPSEINLDADVLSEGTEMDSSSHFQGNLHNKEQFNDTTDLVLTDEPAGTFGNTLAEGCPFQPKPLPSSVVNMGQDIESTLMEEDFEFEYVADEERCE